EVAFEQPASQRGGTEWRLRQPPAVEREQVLFEETLVELRVVRDEQRVPREAQKPAYDGSARRRAHQLLAAQAGQPSDRLRQRDPRVHERLERVDELEPAHTHGAQLADAIACRREAGRLQVED